MEIRYATDFFALENLSYEERQLLKAEIEYVLKISTAFERTMETNDGEYSFAIQCVDFEREMIFIDLLEKN